MKASGREIEKRRGESGRERAFLYVVSIKEERKTSVDEILADLSQNLNILSFLAVWSLVW